MPHPFGDPKATLNQIAMEMTLAHLEIAREICATERINSPEVLAALIISLGQNLATMKTT
jgi:hypothetical protein